MDQIYISELNNELKVHSLLANHLALRCLSCQKRCEQYVLYMKMKSC